MTPAELRMVPGGELRAALPIIDAIEALQRAFQQPLPTAPARTVLPTAAEGQLMVMPAVGASAAGVKVLGLREANRALGLPLIQGVFILLDGTSLTPRLVIDGAELTRIRTAALSGLATRLLARQDAHRLVVFGSGVQAAAHVEAMRAVRPVSSLTLVTRTARATARRAAELGGGDVEVRIGDPSAVAEADLVCTCTSSRQPVFDGQLLRHGAHVNAIGAHEPDSRELDDATVARADLIVADDLEAAMAKAGDLLIPLGAGRLVKTRCSVELRDVVSGRVRRRDPTQITLYKSVGSGYQDLIVAEAAAKALIDPPR